MPSARAGKKGSLQLLKDPHPGKGKKIYFLERGRLGLVPTEKSDGGDVQDYVR